MDNILQKLLRPILTQANAALQIPAARRQANTNYLPREGYVFGKNSEGETDPNFQISRNLVFGDPSRILGTTVDPTPTPTPQPTMHPNTPKEFVDLIQTEAKRVGIPDYQFSNLLNRESMGFSPDVISGKINSPVGAQGVAQFMPQTVADWQMFTRRQFDPYVPEQAIPAAADYLKWLRSQIPKRDLAGTYAAYNWGVGNVLSGLDQYGNFQSMYPNMPQETQDYVPAVMGQAWEY